MCQEQGLNPALQEVESALGRVRPSRVGLDRDLLMFNAGLAAARPSRTWQALSGVLGVLLLCAVLVRPGPRAPESMNSETHVQEYRVPAQGQDIEPLGQMTYIRLRQQVLKQGLEALPKDPGTGRNNKLDSREDLMTILAS